MGRGLFKSLDGKQITIQFPYWDRSSTFTEVDKKDSYTGGIPLLQWRQLPDQDDLKIRVEFRSLLFSLLIHQAFEALLQLDVVGIVYTYMADFGVDGFGEGEDDVMTP